MLTFAFLLGNYLQIIPIIPSFPDLRLKPVTLQGFERKGFLPRREVAEAESLQADGRWDEVKHLGDHGET